MEDTVTTEPRCFRKNAGMAEENCVGRNGTPEDVARAMEYLADAEFVTGNVLNVNGGLVV